MNAKEVAAAEFRESDPANSADGQTEVAWLVMFGASVRSARKVRGLRQEDLADLIGLGRPSIANIEAGRQRTSAYIAARLVAELGMTVPGWQANTTAALLAQQLAQARQALMDVLDHAHDATKAARSGLG